MSEQGGSLDTLIGPYTLDFTCQECGLEVRETSEMMWLATPALCASCRAIETKKAEVRWDAKLRDEFEVMVLALRAEGYSGKLLRRAGELLDHPERVDVKKYAEDRSGGSRVDSAEGFLSWVEHKDWSDDE
jgi:hypothetical protein